MEKFKQKLRIRTILMTTLILGIAMINGILILNRDKLPKVPDFINGFQVGVFTGLEIILIYFVIRYVVAMKTDTKLKMLYIKETDERKQMISQMTGSIGLTTSMIGLATGTVISGFFSKEVFFSLLCATVFVELVGASLKLYYNKKY